MMNRVAPTAPPGIALTTVETHVLDLLLQDRPGSQSRPAALSSYLTKIARLGATLHAPRTLRPETPSCGAVCPGSRTSNSVSLSGRSLGVIESDTVRLPRASPGPPPPHPNASPCSWRGAICGPRLALAAKPGFISRHNSEPGPHIFAKPLDIVGSPGIVEKVEVEALREVR